METPPFHENLPTPMRITKVMFPSRWVNFNGEANGTAEFKLGLGPCGKSVTRLEVERTDQLLTVRQYYAGGTAKDFTYRLVDITGRIEVSYE